MSPFTRLEESRGRIPFLAYDRRRVDGCFAIRRHAYGRRAVTLMDQSEKGHRHDSQAVAFEAIAI